jgi:formylglycine-generating enzyme required for sulfatase activity
MNTSDRRGSAASVLPPSLLLLALLLGPAGCHRKNSVEAGPDAATTRPKAALSPLTNMVAIHAGTFLRIKFPVTITHDFWIGKFEVAQGEFMAVLGRNPSHFTGDSNRPVEKVTFFDATSYCNALTRRERAAGRLTADYEYRLPTEAEWEYACRAGTTNEFSFGDEASPSVADQFAWTAENSEATTHPVGLKRPNAWGLYDMHGNVWEWCLDWYEPYPAAAVTDPTGPPSSKFKVFKGGGWNQEIAFARSANRFMMSPSNGIHFVGFRLALGHVPLQRAP